MSNDTPRSTARRRWMIQGIGILGAVVLVFHVAGGWYFSEQIRTDALMPTAPLRDFGVSIEHLDGTTVTLGGNDDAIDEPGVYALVWDGGFAHVGDVVDTSGGLVTRTLLSVAGGPPPPPPTEVDLDGWMYPSDPGDIDLAFESVSYPSPLGAMAAWYVPASDGTSDVWAIHIHGWRADRREALRTLGTFHAAGIDSLVIEYRNDPDAPPDPSGFYRFGRTEWQDVEGAVGHALEHGATEFVLVGYSSGAAAAMAFVEESHLADVIAGAVFDSPNVDFGRVIQTEAADTALIPGLPMTVPGSLSASAMLISDIRFDIGWDAINYVDRVEAWLVPTLLVHGDADETVPPGVSQEFAAAQPGVVELVVVPGADHVQSWNVNRDLYEAKLLDFLEGL